MISVKYAFSLPSVFCLDSANDASLFEGPGAELEPAGPAATVKLRGHRCLRPDSERLMT